MATTDDPVVHPDALELAALLRAEWPLVRERIRLSGHPTCDGDDDGDNGTDDDAAADDGADGNEDRDDDDDAGTTGATGAAGGEPDWKKMARKHEREAKKAREREAQLTAKLKEREDADKSEHEKAVEAARAEGESAALSKYEQQRRADRLETAVIRLAAKGVKLGDGDDAKTVRFADPDDVQMFIERQLAKGELDADEIYDKDGKVVTSVLTAALVDLATDKPGWLEQQNGGNGGGRSAGDADAGKGKGGSNALEGMSPEEHLKQIQATRRR